MKIVRLNDKGNGIISRKPVKMVTAVRKVRVSNPDTVTVCLPMFLPSTNHAPHTFQIHTHLLNSLTTALYSTGF